MRYTKWLIFMLVFLFHSLLNIYSAPLHSVFYRQVCRWVSTPIEFLFLFLVTKLSLEWVCREIQVLVWEYLLIHGCILIEIREAPNTRGRIVSLEWLPYSLPLSESYHRSICGKWCGCLFSCHHWPLGLTRSISISLQI